MHVPLQVAGLPTDSVLLADRSEICLISAGGKTEYRGTGEDMHFYKEGPDFGEAQTYQKLTCQLPCIIGAIDLLTFYGRPLGQLYPLAR